MPILVTLNVYSGRPDPLWILPDKKARELAELLRSLREQTALKARGFPPKPGYRGFSLRSIPEGAFGGLRLIAHAGIVDLGPEAPSLLDPGCTVERWLLENGKVSIPESLMEYVAAEINKTMMQRMKNDQWRRDLGGRSFFQTPECQSEKSKAKDAPHFEPSCWNIPDIQSVNNCYNYVNDCQLLSFTNPGESQGVTFSMMCKDDPCAGLTGVITAAMKDRLVVVPNFSDPRAEGEGWYVALAVWPEHDYHWYRQDLDGCWSHKLGSGAVSNVDGSEQIITDPSSSTCDRDCYTDFCCFMLRPSAPR